ncbi:MAG: GNAT family N-acetyltransferase, partial [Bacteroidota bacterium]
TLLPLSHDGLVLLQKGRHQMEAHLHLPVSSMDLEVDFMAEFPGSLSFCIEGVATHPDRPNWYTHWLILDKNTHMTMGGIGLSGLPDHLGHTQVGYFVDAHQRRGGVATLALQALMEWAFLEPGLIAVVAYTPVDNLPSQRVLEHNGFERVGLEEKDSIIIKWEKLR